MFVTEKSFMDGLTEKTKEWLERNKGKEGKQVAKPAEKKEEKKKTIKEVKK